MASAHLTSQMGYNAAKGEYTDMIAAGILDPLKVVKTALIDASGVSSLLFTSEACIVEAPEDKAPAGPPMGGMVRRHVRALR